MQIGTDKFGVVPSLRGSRGIVAAIVAAHDAGMTPAEIADWWHIDAEDVLAVLIYLRSVER